MSDRSRFIIFVAGVVLIMVSIIIIRSVTHSYNGAYQYLIEELPLYIGVLAILIYAQFMIGTTYGRKPGAKVTRTTKNGRYQELKNKYKFKFQKQQKRVQKLKEARSQLNEKVNKLGKDKSEIESILNDLYSQNQGKLSQKLVFQNTSLFRYEQYFLTTINLIKILRKEGLDDFKIEASLAFSASIKLYELLNLLSERNADFTERDLNSLLKEYTTDLNDALNHVEALQYGMINTYRPDSHQSVGLVEKNDQVKMRSFKITGKSKGSIIYKAMVEKK